MMMDKNQFKSLFVLISGVLCAACGSGGTNAPLSMDNPASQYCAERGGKLEIIEEPAGQVGMCHLPSGEVIEEWTLFRRDHLSQ